MEWSSALVVPQRHRSSSAPSGSPKRQPVGLGGGPGVIAVKEALNQTRPGSKSQQTLDMGRLLAGLQRGSIPGADGSVSFLCQKYKNFNERLQRAEFEEEELKHRCGILDAEKCAEETAVDTDRVELEASVAAAIEEVRALESNLVEVHQEESLVMEELQQARSEIDAANTRRKALDVQCASESARLAQANSRIRQFEMSKPTGHEELRRFLERLEVVKSQHASAEATLHASRERTEQYEIRALALRAELAEEEEAREYESEAAGAQREELSDARNELALLKERFTEKQVGVQRQDEELRRLSDSRRTLARELQRRETWIVDAQSKVCGLQTTEKGVERLTLETAQVRSQLVVEEDAERRTETANCKREAAIADSERKLTEKAQNLEEFETRNSMLRSEIATIESERRQLEELIEQLQHDQATNGGYRSNMEAELRVLTTEQDRLRRERDEQTTWRNDLQQRLSLVEPALAKAKRRVRNLEARLESVRSTATVESQRNERLERETNACQGKALALRDENARLSEQCTEFEAQLTQSSSFRTAGKMGPSVMLRGRGGNITVLGSGGATPRESTSVGRRCPATIATPNSRSLNSL